MVGCFEEFGSVGVLRDDFSSEFIYLPRLLHHGLAGIWKDADVEDVAPNPPRLIWHTALVGH